MEKHFLVEQPPIADKYRLLVDDISDKRNFGFTADMDKIRYNQRLLGEDFEKDVEIQKLFTDDGLSCVFPLGCFITVMQLSKDGTKGKMTFFDFDIDTDKAGLRPILEQQFSENIVNEWFKVYDLLSSDFSEDDDRFELLRPNFE